MPTHRLLTSLWLALAGILAPLATEASDAMKFRTLLPAVVRVEASNADGSFSIGSGVLLGKGVVATNCHVTQHATSIQIVRGGRQSEIDSQFSNVGHDLCLLRSGDLNDTQGVAFADEPPQVGQAVFAVGYGGGLTARISRGEIEATYQYDEGKVIQTSAQFIPGASGGGLFDDKGRLIGLISFFSPEPPARHFCLPATWIRWALEHFDGQPVGPQTGRPFWQEPENRQPYFLRAASLEAGGDWPALADLAQEWSFSESGNPSSWLALGKAYAHLDRKGPSIAAFQAAVAMDADYSPAWYELGLIYAERCRVAETNLVLDVLARLHGRLAAALAEERNRCGNDEASSRGG